LYTARTFGTVLAGGSVSPFSTATRQTISDLGTIAVVVAFLWMLLF